MHLLECSQKCLDTGFLNITPGSVYFSPSPLLPPWSQLFAIVKYWKLLTVIIPLNGVGKMEAGEGVGLLQTFWCNGLGGWPSTSIVLSFSYDSYEQAGLRTAALDSLFWLSHLHFLSSYPFHSRCSNHTGLWVPRKVLIPSAGILSPQASPGNFINPSESTSP